MKLAESTWPEVDALDRDTVVLLPTGSLEQHGPHLPLFTDSLLVTAVAEAVERELPGEVLLLPTLWLGASGHHLAFAGSLSASFSGYMDAIERCVESLLRPGFRRFYVLNGHGGNREPNGVVLRTLMERHPDAAFAHAGYFDFIPEAVLQTLAGPLKGIRHACEAEASLMMHVRPELVRTDRLRDDGLVAEPAVRGLLAPFDVLTEQGSFGYATLATPETGRRLFEAAVAGTVAELRAMREGPVYLSMDPQSPL